MDQQVPPGVACLWLYN